MSDLPGLGRVARERPDAAALRADIGTIVARELTEVERLFRENLASPVRIVDEIGSFVASGGGKRIRPTLHLLCARLCGYDGPHDVLLGAVLEFIHCATLIHDDIIDQATLRRGRPAVNHRWGNDITVLFGDYMFAKAMEMALRADSLRVMQKLAAVTLRMTEGEMLQTRYVGRLDLRVDEYLDLVEKKTASLFACCCELAGILAGVSPEHEQALGAYGLHLGFVFQLVDDLLDFTGDPARLGKPAASDLSEGKATLAVIELLQQSGPAERELVQRILDSADDRASQDIDALRVLLEDCGAIRRVYALAAEHARQAERQLERFGEGPAGRALHSLPELLLARDR